MRRFCISAISTFLAFAAGLFTASSWNSHRQMVVIQPASASVLDRYTPPSPPPPPIPNELTVAPDREYVFAQGRLKLVPEKVRLQSESLHYDIDVKYPQIVGEDNPNYEKANQLIKALATEKYQWPLNLSKEEMRTDQEKHPGTFNSVNVDYEISIATDSFLSLFFIGYSYGIGAAHAVQESVSVNYDLTSGRQLKLADLFKPGSNYLEFISERCLDELSTDDRPAPMKGSLTPSAKNFESWHITPSGITFSFDACEVFACAEGDQAVEIPFGDMKHLLNTGIPGKFKITYP